MLIQLVRCILRSVNGGNLSSNNGGTLSSDSGGIGVVGILRSDNGGTGHLSKVTNSKLRKLIQPVLIQLAGCALQSHNGGTFGSESGRTGYLSKVASSKFKKLIQPNRVSTSYSSLR